MINPIEKYTGCTTEQVIAFLARDYNVRATAEDFKKVRKQKLVPIYVAAIGYTEILVSNPEYKVYWWEPMVDFVKVVWRMAKSPDCMYLIVRAIRNGYRNIDKHEYADAFRQQARERTEKEKAKLVATSTTVDDGHLRFTRKVDENGVIQLQRLKND